MGRVIDKKLENEKEVEEKRLEKNVEWNIIIPYLL